MAAAYTSSSISPSQTWPLSAPSGNGSPSCQIGLLGCLAVSSLFFQKMLATFQLRGSLTNASWCQYVSSGTMTSIHDVTIVAPVGSTSTLVFHVTGLPVRLSGDGVGSHFA